MYFGSGEVEEVKAITSLFDYNQENKIKFGLVKAKGKGLCNAVKEADSELGI